MSSYLQQSIEYLKGVGPQRADLLKKELQIFTLNDLLHHFPFRYIDRTEMFTTSDIKPESQHIQLRGIISQPQAIGSGKAKRLVARFSDEHGQIELVWFRGIRWIQDAIKPGNEYLVFGKPTFYNRKANIVHPEIELLTNRPDVILEKLQPVYPSTEKLKTKGLDSRGIQKLVSTMMKDIKSNDVIENLPNPIISKNKLIDRFTAYQWIHFPQIDKQVQQASYRLIYEEFFNVQFEMLFKKQMTHRIFSGFQFPEVGNYFNDYFKNLLPFELTNAQKRVLKEIRHDTRSGKQMNRLLQGDVGSGKTVVALMTILMALDNGFQACLMAPTEILANQHYDGLKKDLEILKIPVALLTGSIKGKSREEILVALQANNIKLLIGTHALIEAPVQYQNLGLVVIDEQHKFGVAQRAKLWKKNTKPPHVLVMTATPIPRTLAMTLFGDLDISVIDELPPGRKPIKTIHRTDSQRLRLFGFIEEEIKKGRQTYIVYPLINESIKLDYKDLMDGFESIKRRFPKIPTSIVHGQMKADDKDFEMQRFVNGETKIMVATTVIEVGVNVPNATIMVVESAERFGLSQLHQLRGRVGRGGDQSYCVLMTGNKLSREAKTRISTMVQTNDGFEIAEVDLRLRGPGNMAGTQQSGIVPLNIGNLVKDQAILQLARNDVFDLLEADPDLNQPEHVMLKQLIQSRKGNLHWSHIS